MLPRSCHAYGPWPWRVCAQDALKQQGPPPKDSQGKGKQLQVKLEGMQGGVDEQR